MAGSYAQRTTIKCHYLWGSTWLHIPRAEKALSIPSRGGEGQSQSLTGITPLAFCIKTIVAAGRRLHPAFKVTGALKEAHWRLPTSWQHKGWCYQPLSDNRRAFSTFSLSLFFSLLASVLLEGTRAVLCWILLVAGREKEISFLLLPPIPASSTQH